MIMVQEAIGLGQRIERYEIYVDGNRVVNGTTVGYKRLQKVGARGLPMHAKRVKIRVVKSKGLPLISSIGLFLDPFLQL